MRSEAALCTAMRSDLLRLLPGAVVTKHHDLSTAGIPDLSINWHFKTQWVEAKLMKPVETKKAFLKHFDELQLANAILLERQQQTFYFVAYPINTELRAVIWGPKTLKSFLDWPEMEPYYWHGELTCGTLRQGLEFLAHQIGMPR